VDTFYLIFHTFVILFNLFGWIWRPTRKANLALLMLTAFSWFGLGFWYGWGYCFLTDWHYRALEKAGIRNLPDSYIKYLADRLTGYDFDAALADSLTVGGFLLALAASVYFNVRDLKKS
jgi:hypothetical protein